MAEGTAHMLLNVLRFDSLCFSTAPFLKRFDYKIKTKNRVFHLS